MLDNKKLSLVLFGSLAVNIFLAGLVVGKWAHRPEREHHDREHHEHPGAKNEAVKERKNDAHPDKRNHGKKEHSRSDADESPRGNGLPHHRENSGDGSGDLMLLRHMIRVMGGPTDPRIATLRAKSKENMKESRVRMAKAHEAVRAALSAQNFDNAALKQALEQLRDARASSQEKAQEGVLALAALMTPEERVKMAEYKPGAGERRGRPRPGPRDKAP